jgi:cob(I)alamin adenosyltransferase
MKIYTRTGDDGSTGLFGGQRISKSDPRIDCTGTIDELNASIGWAAAALPGGDVSAAPLRIIQAELFVIGSQLSAADAMAPPAALPTLEDAAVGRLEMEIDAATTELPPLKNFILPGGSEAAARLHVARTVCRRAERRLVSFAHDRPVPQILLTYLNRLSDWLFVQARLANARASVADIPWSAR